MDGIIEEICRVRSVSDIRYPSLRRWQDYLRNEVQPKLDSYQELMSKSATQTRKPKGASDAASE